MFGFGKKKEASKVKVANLKEHLYIFGWHSPYYANPTCASDLSQPKDFHGFLNRAVLYIKLEQNELALDDIAQALKLASGYPPAIGTRAIAYINSGKLNDALQDLNYLIDSFAEGKVNDAWLYYTRGNAYMKMNNKEKAQTDFNDAIRLDPKYKDFIC